MTFSRQKKRGRIRLNQALPNWALLSQYRSGLEVFFEYRVHNNLEDDLHVTSICGSGEVRVDHLPRGQVLVLEQVLDIARSTVNILVTTCMRKKSTKIMNIIICIFVCLIRFFTSQSTIFQLCRSRSSWVEPVLSKD